jgi:hypothetical protein
MNMVLWIFSLHVCTIPLELTNLHFTQNYTMNEQPQMPDPHARTQLPGGGGDWVQLFSGGHIVEIFKASVAQYGYLVTAETPKPRRTGGRTWWVNDSVEVA